MAFLSKLSRSIWAPHDGASGGGGPGQLRSKSVKREDAQDFMSQQAGGRNSGYDLDGTNVGIDPMAEFTNFYDESEELDQEKDSLKQQQDKFGIGYQQAELRGLSVDATDFAQRYGEPRGSPARDTPSGSGEDGVNRQEHRLHGEEMARPSSKYIKLEPENGTQSDVLGNTAETAGHQPVGEGANSHLNSEQQQRSIETARLFRREANTDDRSCVPGKPRDYERIRSENDVGETHRIEKEAIYENKKQHEEGAARHADVAKGGPQIDADRHLYRNYGFEDQLPIRYGPDGHHAMNLRAPPTPHPHGNVQKYTEAHQHSDITNAQEHDATRDARWEDRRLPQEPDEDSLADFRADADRIFQGRSHSIPQQVGYNFFNHNSALLSGTHDGQYRLKAPDKMRPYHRYPFFENEQNQPQLPRQARKDHGEVATSYRTDTPSSLSTNMPGYGMSGSGSARDDSQSRYLGRQPVPGHMLTDSHPGMNMSVPNPMLFSSHQAVSGSQQRNGRFFERRIDAQEHQYSFEQMQMPASTHFRQEYPGRHHGYYTSAQSPMNPQDISQASTALGKRKAAILDSEDDEFKASQQSDENEDTDSSDDDEPLMIRSRRHHTFDSVHGSDSQMSSQTQGQHDKSEDEETQYMNSNVYDPDANDAGACVETRSGHALQASALVKTSPLPPNEQIQSAVLSPSSNTDVISFALPRYNIEPRLDKDQPSVKVSLPGVVREILLLSPDHAAQEVHLLTQIFLPGQQALTAGDPQPQIAILNFHTVCVMVLDAYVAFEFGDLTPGSTHNVNEAEESARVHDAKDADVDEIFFAAVDRWRVGMTRGEKKSYALIRGVQEFCDISLDIIHYIKEYGLLRAEVKEKLRKRKVRNDKGTKKGPRKQAAAKPAGAKRGPGRPRAQDGGTRKKTVTTLQPRKKAKTEQHQKYGSIEVKKAGKRK